MHTKKEEGIYETALASALQARADSNRRREARNLQTVAAIERKHLAGCRAGDRCQYVISWKLGQERVRLNAEARAMREG